MPSRFRVVVGAAGFLVSILAGPSGAQAELTRSSIRVSYEFCNQGEPAKLPKKFVLTVCQVAPPVPGPPPCPAKMNTLYFKLYWDASSNRETGVAASLYDEQGQLLERTTGVAEIEGQQLSARFAAPRPRQAGDWIDLEFRLPRKVRKLRHDECLNMYVAPVVVRRGSGS